MDKLGSKKRLYAGLGDFARERRMEEMRKKYSTGNPELDAASELQDEAAEAAEMPMMKGGNSKLGGEADFESDLDEMAEDEKWMMKQKG